MTNSVANKQMTEDDVVARLRSGMTIGIGGWGSRRKPMCLRRANLRSALVHLNRADAHGNAQFLGVDPYFDDLFCMAAERAYVSCERIVPTEELTAHAPVQSLLLQRWMVHGVVEAPGGAHFTACEPDYG